MRRSFRVSDSFISKLNYLQEQTKLNGIVKTQEQIFDEMIELYLLYQSDEIKIFISDEIQNQMINLNKLMIENFAKIHNGMMDHLDERINDLHKAIINRTK